MKTEIRTRAWVRVGNESVDVDTLSPEMRQALAEKLALTYFNTLYAGRAVFSPREDKDGVSAKHACAGTA